jgi:uncharacterized Tic20 family protein
MSVPPEYVPPPPVGDIPTAAVAVPSPDERQWALFAHLAALAGLVVPFGSVIGPLVIWLIKKDTMPFVNQQGKEALNFNITVAIAAIVCAILIFVLIGMILLPVLAIVWLIFVIVATINASNGVAYRYPLTIRFIQ